VQFISAEAVHVAAVSMQPRYATQRHEVWQPLAVQHNTGVVSFSSLANAYASSALST
jgi:aryl-alcohol dehydrogenase-like predicted oxidoreductase